MQCEVPFRKKKGIQITWEGSKIFWFHNVNWVWFKQKSSLCKLKTNDKGQGKKLKFYFASRTHCKQIKKKIRGKASNKYMLELINIQGVKLIFFSNSHLAPKFFKVVANSKKVGCHFQRQTKPFFTLSAF